MARRLADFVSLCQDVLPASSASPPRLRHSCQSPNILSNELKFNSEMAACYESGIL